MWAWFRRLWNYLRRLFMSHDENIEPPAGGDRPPPSREIGEELQDFFLELLKGSNLKRYQSDDRADFVAEYIEAYPSRRGRPLSDHAQRLINSRDLREIEEHIGEITGSRAVILYVVCPPM